MEASQKTDKYAYYLMESNKLFGNGPCLAVSYMASKKEVEENHLTSNNVVLFMRSVYLDNVEKFKDQDFGDIVHNMFDETQPIYVRVQSECLLGVYGDSHCDCEEQRKNSINTIANSQGIFFHLPQEAQGKGLHYKLKELELQVSGRNQQGKFVGIKTRDQAHEYLCNDAKFEDDRSYEIIAKILADLSLSSYNFALFTDGKKKVKTLSEKGFSCFAIKTTNENSKVNKDNISEFLIKILDESHTYDETLIQEITTFISRRELNERTIETFAKIIDKIKANGIEVLTESQKNLFLETYERIFCGDELHYTFHNQNITKSHYKFSCRVNAKIFPVLCRIYKKNIFCRISNETLYFFNNQKTKDITKIRISRVLDVDGNSDFFMKGYTHSHVTTFTKDGKRFIENETDIAALQSFYGNKDYEFTREIQMITFISEKKTTKSSLAIYIKRIPKIGNRILDVFGTKEDIKILIDEIFRIDKNVILGFISDKSMENEEYSEYNLKFADLNSSIQAELDVYHALLNNYSNNNIQ